MINDLDLLGEPIPTPATARRGTGRPTFEVTPELLETVRRLRNAKTKAKHIAAAIGCSVPTLRRCFPSETSINPVDRIVKRPARPDARKVGRRPHVVTDESRRQAQMLRDDGNSLRRTAEALGVSVATVLKRYRAGLDEPPAPDQRQAGLFDRSSDV